MTTEMLQKTLKVLQLASFLVIVKPADGFDSDGPYHCSNNGVCGEPLFVTRILNKTNALAAQQAAMVHFPNTPEFQQVRHTPSYSGFFTVNETLNSNIFFWFFPAETNPKDSPMLFWLEGGPGCASTQDVFLPSGPFQVGNDLKLTPGPNRWTKNLNVLYLDSPVGAGFSFTKNVSGYAKTQKDYTRDLYSALSQFFLLFPDHQTSNFYIAGVSYAGKYVPVLAYEIHERNPTAPTKINLEGIAIGNGLVNPLVQVGYSEFLYGISLIDSETKLRLEVIENEIKSLILNQEYKAAAIKLNNGYLFTNNGTESMMVNVTGVRVDDYLSSYADTEKDDSYQNLAKMVCMPELRKSIHVGSQDYWILDIKSHNYLNDDTVLSVAPKLQTLMDNYRVILYSGQLDIICNYRLMIDYVKKLKWEGAQEYLNATRHQWWVAGELAGYSKTAGNFTEILVRDAGHAVHLDQPSWMIDLLKRLSHNIPFYEN